MMTSDQQDLQASASRYLRERPPVSSSAPKADFGDWAQFAALGWLGVALDEAHGGFGGPAEMALLAQEIAVAAAPEPFLQSAVVPTVFLANAPSSHARHGLLERVISGEHRLVAAFDLPGPFCDYPVKCTRVGDDLRIQGTLSHVFGGAGAHSVLFAAHHADDPLIRTVILLDTAAAGVRHSRAASIDGRQASFFEIDTVVPATEVEWPEHTAAVAAFELAQDAGLLGQCAEAFGLMQHLFELTRGYLLERRQFGQVLAQFQALRHRLADMYAELEQARAMLGCAVRGMSLAPAAARSRRLSACKLRIARAGRLIGAQAIQLHGAIALTQEYAVGRAYQRLLVLDKTWGDAEFHARRFNAAAGVAND